MDDPQIFCLHITTGKGNDISFYNRGILKLNNVNIAQSTIDYTSTDFDYNAIVYNEFSGTVEINNCNIEYMVNTGISNYGTCIISNSLINHQYYTLSSLLDPNQDVGIRNFADATLIIKNSSRVLYFDKAIVNYGAVYIYDSFLISNILTIESTYLSGVSPTIEISDTTFTAPDDTWYAERATLQFEFDYDYPQFIHANGTTLYISNCFFTSNALTIAVHNNSDLTLEDSTILYVTSSLQYPNLYLGDGSVSRIIGNVFWLNSGFAIHAASGSRACIFTNYFANRALYIEEGSTFFSCLYSNPTEPSGSCNTEFGSLDTTLNPDATLLGYVDTDGFNLFRWMYDLYGDTNSYALNAPIVSFGDFSCHDCSFSCILSNTTELNLSPRIQTYLDNACDGMDFVYILGGFGRLVNVEVKNGGDIMFSDLVCQHDCHLTDLSNDYLLLQQAEIDCDGTDTISSSVLFEMSFDLTSNNAGSLSDSQVSTTISTILQTIFDGSESVSTNATISNDNSARVIHNRLLLQESITVDSESIVYYSDQDAATAVATATSDSDTFESTVTEALEAALSSTDSSIEDTLSYSTSSTDGSMSDESSTDSITAATGVPYTIGIIDATGDQFEYIERMRLNQTDLLNATITNNLTIYAGGTLEFFIVVIDERNSIVDSSLFNVSFEVYIESENLEIALSSSFYIIYDTNNIPKQSISMTMLDVGDLNRTFNITVSVSDSILYTSTVSLFVDLCPPGYGVLGLQCVECQAGYYTIEKNNYKCKSCPTDGGVECNGGVDLIIKSDWWQYSDDDGTLYLVDCPESVCCQIENGCDYFDDSRWFCAPNRERSSPLCGACIDGYSDVLVGTGCANCQGKAYWYWAFVPLFGCIGFVTFVTFNQKKEKGEEKYILPKHKVIRVALLKNLAYYYQILNLAFPNNVTVYLRSVLALFSLTIESSSNERDDSVPTRWCFLEYMTPVQKLSLNFFGPLLAYFVLLIIRLINPSQLGGRVPHFADAFGQITLMSLGSVVTTALKLIGCRKVESMCCRMHDGYPFFFETNRVGK